ncbi:MAG TPA: hypothetical protein VNK46_15235 [Nitrospiraceae bacterium]|nr:hypothetical protein [Nitrospiraceae bacterium]
MHTVFEYHAVMGPDALAAFLHEHRITFPLGVGEPSADGSPLRMTMRAYRMRGALTTILDGWTGPAP